MNLFDDPQNCCACTACVQICPRKAISLQADSEGFGYPAIEETLCVECGLCREVCAFQRDRENRATPSSGSLSRVFAVKHRNVAIRSQSQSGGLFTLLSDPVLDTGGVIYGAGFCSDFSVAHQRAETREARDALRGSKYVQSDMGMAFPDVRRDLADGCAVLFSGTPCQVAGLKRYLTVTKTEQSHLLVCDLVCHGVPSPKIWRDYLASLEVEKGQKIIDARFRDTQRFGWRTGIGAVTFEDNHTETTESFAQLFYGDLILRPSCHVCPYATLHRASDVTMGDFWGIERAHPAFDDNIGISLALIHSEKGLRAFEAASARMEFVESSAEECLQPNLCTPSKPSLRRERFWRDYGCRELDFILMKYASFELKKQNIKRALREWTMNMKIWNFIQKIR